MLWGVYLLRLRSNIPQSPSPQSATNPKLAHPLHRRNYGKPLHQRFSGFLQKTTQSMFFWIFMENHTIYVSLDYPEQPLYQRFF